MTQRSFSADLAKFGVLVDKRCTALIRQTALGTLDDLHNHNPVDSGWSRASWQVSINKAATGVYSYYTGSWVSGNRPAGNKPPHGTAMNFPQQKDLLPALKYSDKVYFTNNVPYIGFVEDKYKFIAGVMHRTKTSLYAIAGRLAK